MTPKVAPLQDLAGKKVRQRLAQFGPNALSFAHPSRAGSRP